jgi:hypothetical protein
MTGDGPEPRLAARLWVSAQVRLCDAHFIPMVISRRGDPDAGAVLVRLVRGPQTNLMLARHTQLDGTTGWMTVGGDDAMDDETADAYIGRQVDRDPDLWVLDVEDPRGRYWPDRPIDAEDG